MVGRTSAGKQSFRVFAVVEALRNGSADVRGALLPFFHPILATLNEQIFDPATVSERMNEAYRWNMTGDVVEGFISSFAEMKWVTELQGNEEATYYRITCETPDFAPSKLPDQLKRISNEFWTFVQALSPVLQVGRSADDLLNILVKWLVSIDAYTEDDLASKVRETSRAGAKIKVYEVLPNEGGLSSDDQYLCARFVGTVLAANGEGKETLLSIAKIGLLTDTVQDFTRPASAVRKTDLVVYLDAPVAMDLLSVSGAKSQENVSSVITRLKEIGASIRIFQISIEEIRQNLRSVLGRPSPERTGPTATAIRHREVLESYVREICARPEAALRRLDIQIVDRKLDQFPQEHKFFPDAAYKDVYSVVNWHIGDAPRHHDALTSTLIMRFRRGVATADVFEAKHVLITKNGILPKGVRRSCIQMGYLPSYAVGPVIHQREMATAIWLRAGLGGDQDELPERYLLASCERVLQLRPDLVDRVRSEAAKINEQTAEQLDMLLTIDRSTQILMDKTLNVSRVVTSQNFEEILEEMKKSLVSENLAATKAEVAAVRAEAETKIASAADQAVERERAARAAVEEEAARAQRLSEALRLKQTEDHAAIDALIVHVNQMILARRRRIRWGMFASILLLALVPIGINTMGIVSKVALAAALVGAALINHWVNWIYRLFKVEGHLKRYAFDTLSLEGAQRGLHPKVENSEFAFDEENLELKVVVYPKAG